MVIAILYQMKQTNWRKLKVVHPDQFLDPMPLAEQGINPNFFSIDHSTITNIYKSTYTNQAIHAAHMEW